MERIAVSITEKDIENLPQLDRIEYKLENEKIKEGITDFLSWYYLKKGIIPIAFLLVFIYYAGNGILRSQILEEMLGKILKVLFLVMFVAIPFDIYYLIQEMKKKGKLNDKFFNKKEEKWQKKK